MLLNSLLRSPFLPLGEHLVAVAVVAVAVAAAAVVVAAVVVVEPVVIVVGVAADGSCFANAVVILTSAAISDLCE